ncbi:MAG: lipoyl(octanoyl) transferase LipB [Rikenellaceae bacterium]|nr:lipoyl(octanoyl) transferase LipB [Rikenellaceae bacterium]
MERVVLEDAGLVGYAACFARQRELFDRLVSGKVRESGCEAGDGCPDAGYGQEDRPCDSGACPAGSPDRGVAPATQVLILCEHPAVYTLGKSGHEGNLLVDETFLRKINASYYRTDRGGDITFHGPGQLVGYPILDLERLGLGLREYVDLLEEAVIATAADYGIGAGRLAGATGVWVGAGGARPRKLCAIGVRSSRYVTMHGFALNVTTDLGYFGYINPCGFTDKGVTSLAAELGRAVMMDEVKVRYGRHFARLFGVELE